MITIKHTASVDLDRLYRLILWSAKANITANKFDFCPKSMVRFSAVVSLAWKEQCEDISVCSSNGMATHQNLIPFQRNLVFEDQHLVCYFHNPHKQTNPSISDK